MSPHHHGAHDQTAEEAAVMWTPAFWDDRYRAADQLWSGSPNPLLVEHVTGLTPGHALDVGSGEGADVIWLARQGWTVIGLDVSAVALERAAAHAVAAGPEIAANATWLQGDVLAWEPAVDEFDLVSAQFMHLPRQALHDLHRRLARSVRPGGTLLVVSHHPLDLETTMRRPNLHNLFATAEEMAVVLDPDVWEITTGAPSRQARDPEGDVVTLHDAVLRAVRGLGSV